MTLLVTSLVTSHSRDITGDITLMRHHRWYPTHVMSLVISHSRDITGDITLTWHHWWYHTHVTSLVISYSRDVTGDITLTWHQTWDHWWYQTFVISNDITHDITDEIFADDEPGYFSVLCVLCEVTHHWWHHTWHHVLSPILWTNRRQWHITHLNTSTRWGCSSCYKYDQYWVGV